MDKIRWGIIGCGDVTEVKSGPALQKADGSELVAVMRRDGALARDYAARHGVPRWYDDAAALLADPAVNAIYIATPPSSHLDYTLMAAAAGMPAYVEKPMALNHAECQAMIAACEMAGTPLFVAYYRRALPRFLKIKALLDAGAIGAIRAVSITLHRPPKPADADADKRPWRVNPAIAGGGHFVDLAAHMLDLLDFFLGPISAVRGFAANQGTLYPAEDIVSGSFQFANGVIGNGLWCFSGAAEQDETEIVGTAGSIRYATFANRPVTLTTPAGTQQFPFTDPIHIQQPLIQTVVNALRGAGECPSSGRSAARTSWVMDQLLADYYR